MSTPPCQCAMPPVIADLRLWSEGAGTMLIKPCRFVGEFRRECCMLSCAACMSDNPNACKAGWVGLQGACRVWQSGQQCFARGSTEFCTSPEPLQDA